jgi:hypothetical protein
MTMTENKKPYDILQENMGKKNNKIKGHINYLRKAHYVGTHAVLDAAKADGFSGDATDLTQEHFQKYSRIAAEKGVNHLIGELLAKELGKDGPLNVHPDRQEWLENMTLQSYFGLPKKQLVDRWSQEYSQYESIAHPPDNLQQFIKENKVVEKLDSAFDSHLYDGLSDSDATHLVDHVQNSSGLEGIIDPSKITNIREAVEIVGALGNQESLPQYILQIGGDIQGRKILGKKGNELYNQITSNISTMTEAKAKPQNYKDITSYNAPDRKAA